MALPGPLPIMGTIAAVVKGVAEISKIVNDTKSESTGVVAVPQQPVVVQESSKPVEIISKEPININLNINIYMNGEKLKLPKVEESSSDTGGFDISFF